MRTGGNGPEVPAKGALCFKTIKSNGEVRTETVTHDSCYQAAHWVPLLITANAAALGPYPYSTVTLEDGSVTTPDVELIDSIFNSRLAYYGCPSSQSTMWAAAAEATGTASPGSSPTTGTTSAETNASDGAGKTTFGGVPSWVWYLLVPGLLSGVLSA
ncbi:unnamed protein product [Parascedosporium putredinis]|uniref:Uncharacterized protein n=1 Tax=Parascedosporium putredinis TaxID=1442378 RepID=A0A9P1HE30_9PEZI|nr:unnamed protein product [Parascedosporium putredinis]CAI8004879.1 unnamed protein product [Parascedosporium putredinis]